MLIAIAHPWPLTRESLTCHCLRHADARVRFLYIGGRRFLAVNNISYGDHLSLLNCGKVVGIKRSIVGGCCGVWLMCVLRHSVLYLYSFVWIENFENSGLSHIPICIEIREFKRK